MTSVTGKALLVITRLHEKGESPHYEIDSFIQSCSHADWSYRDSVNEEFSLCEWDDQPLPNAAYRLEPGETVRVAVVYDVWWPRYSFDRDDGADLSYRKARVLRRQKPRKFYRSKALCRSNL